MALLVTIGELQAAMPHLSRDNAVRFTGLLNEAMEWAQINTPLRVPHFLAEVGHESMDFARVEEDLYYSAEGLVSTFKKYFPTLAHAQPFAKRPAMIASKVYANRMGNGSEASRDGYYYRGRGLIQITGKGNYERVTDWLEGRGCPDFVEYPKMLTEDRWAVYSAAAYWLHNNLNYWADMDDVSAIRRRINGGTNGLTDVIARVKLAKAAFKTVCAK